MQTARAVHFKEIFNNPSGEDCYETYIVVSHAQVIKYFVFRCVHYNVWDSEKCMKTNLHVG